MSDTQKIPPPPPPPEDPKLVSQELLQRYFDTVHKGSCPSCGEKKWSVIATPADTCGFLLYYPAKRVQSNGLYPRSLVAPSTFPVVNLVCGVCGLIQNFSYHTIEKWASNQPK